MTLRTGHEDTELDAVVDEREAARRSLQAKRDFVSHLVAYVVVNASLIAVWAFTGGGYFWPAWVLLVGLLAVVPHALALLRSRDRAALTERISTLETTRAGAERLRWSSRSWVSRKYPIWFVAQTSSIPSGLIRRRSDQIPALLTRTFSAG